MLEEEIQELWADFLRGEDKAFAQLFTAFYPQLYNYGLKLAGREEIVKDCIQDTFVYLYEKREQLAREITNVRAYLLTAFRRNLIRKSREQKQESKHLKNRAAQADSSFVIAADEVLIRQELGEERKELILVLLNDLPPRQREILYLKYYQGQSLNEMADTLAVTYQTVANHLHRALKNLRGSDQISVFLKTALVLLCNQVN